MRLFISSICLLLEGFFGYGAWVNYSLGNYFWVGYDLLAMMVQIPLLGFGLREIINQNNTV